MSKAWSIFFACLWAAGSAFGAGKPAQPSRGDAPLNRAAVVKYYNEGDFDPAIAILEDYQKTHSRFSREDSLMVYKYLGVMYCADPQTREKGKTYFYKLLKVDQDAKILDMYVSIMVQEIFKNTLEELMGGMPMDPDAPRQDAFASAPAPETPPQSKPKPEKAAKVSHDRGNAALWWIGVGALAAAGGGYYLYSQSDAKNSDSEIRVKP